MKERKTHTITFSTSPEFEAKLRLTCRMYGMGTPSYIRSILFDGFISPHYHHYQDVEKICGALLVTFRVTKEQFDYVNYVCKTLGWNRSEYIRGMICGRLS